MKIWKYKIEIGRITIHEMPAGARGRYVGLDPVGDPCVWAEVNPDNPKREHRFIVVGTGHDIPTSCIYCGTFTIGAFVGHVYQIP